MTQGLPKQQALFIQTFSFGQLVIGIGLFIGPLNFHAYFVSVHDISSKVFFAVFMVQEKSKCFLNLTIVTRSRNITFERLSSS